MNTREFLELVLPGEGVKVLCVEPPGAAGRGEMSHRTFSTVDRAAQAALEEDAKGNTVFFAVNTFKGWYTNHKNKRAIRAKENVAACRALFDDFDVDPKKDSAYDTIEAAAAGLAQLHRAIRLTPTVVASGGGLHSYITLKDDLGVEEWDELARMKRAVVRHLGVRTDPKVGLNSAQILRPVGTHNRKTDTPRPVVLKKLGKTYPAEEVRAKLQAYLDEHEITVSEVGGQRAQVANPFAAAAEVDYPPSDPDKVAEHCAAIRQFRDTGGDIPEPHWWAGIGVLKFCENGEVTIHEWSSEYDGYSAEETQSKIDEWDYKPTTCQHMDEHTGCMASCPFAGKINSPITLGFTDEAPSVEENTAADDGDDGTATTATGKTQRGNNTKIAGQVIPYWPAKGYRWNGEHLSKAEVDEDGVTHWKPFCRAFIYPVNRIRDSEGTWVVHWRALEKNGEWREFFMPTAELASTDLMAKTLASHEIFLARTKTARGDMADFTAGLIETLQEWRIETKTYNQFGWVDNYTGFVLGTKKITLSGEEDVLCDPAMPPDVATDFGVSGTVDEWVRNIDALYNRPNAEPFQFALCHSMGSLLVEMFGSSNWHGLPLAFTGEGGTGKSTAAKIACGFYGNPEYMERQTGEQGSTLNAAIKRIAIMGAVPVLLDEFSGRTPDELTRTGYALANGRDKERLGSSGRFATVGGQWFKNSFITSNDSIVENIAKLPAGYRVEATQLRFFEVSLPKDYRFAVFPDITQSFIEYHMDNVYGAACRPYIRFLIKNQDWVRRQIVAARDRFNPKSEEDNRERFYRDTIVTALVAGKIAEKLDLISFDLKAMKKWALGQVINMRENRRENNVNLSEHVARFISTLPGRLIITRGSGAPNTKNAEAPMEQLRGPAAGRICTDDRTAVISVQALAEYCKDYNLTPSALRDEMDRSGLLLRGADGKPGRIVALGAGTTLPSIRTRCYDLNYSMLFGGAGLKLVKANGGVTTEAAKKET